MKKSIMQIVSEHNNVLDTRRRIEEIFSNIAECHVTVGGSYMLKYWCEAFSEREVADYDFILRALPKDIYKIETFIGLIAKQTGWIEMPKYYDYKAFYFGHCNGLRVNVILRPSNDLEGEIFEGITEIIDIKRKWCNDAIKQGKKPRYKDIEDITTYESWKDNNELPF